MSSLFTQEWRKLVVWAMFTCKTMYWCALCGQMLISVPWSLDYKIIFDKCNTVLYLQIGSYFSRILTVPRFIKRHAKQTWPCFIGTIKFLICILFISVCCWLMPLFLELKVFTLLMCPSENYVWLVEYFPLQEMKRQCDEKRYGICTEFTLFFVLLTWILKFQYSFQRIVRIHAKCAERKGKV
jgi:hypothetical protein